MQSDIESYINKVALPEKAMIGSLRVLRMLGYGSFSIVYEVLEESTQRKLVAKEYFPVSLAKRSSDGKVFPRSPDVAGEFNQGQRHFMNTGLSLAKVSHQNIVHLLRVEEHRETVYMIMEHLEGVPLSDALDKDKFVPPEKKLEWFNSILGALDHVHDQGLTHLAISPSNFIVHPERGPVLIDFGSEGSNQNLTDDPYLAVEQLTNDTSSLNARTDVYSAGAVFAHLFSGVAPVPSSARQKSKTDPQLSLAASKELNKTYSSAVLDSIDRAISLTPANRFDTVQEWLAESQKSDGLKKKLPLFVVTIAILGMAGWFFFGKGWYLEHEAWKNVDVSKPCTVDAFFSAYPEGRNKNEALELQAACTVLKEEQKVALVDKLVGDLVAIPGGCFQMGSDENDPEKQDNERPHEVCVKGFQMAVFEVTNENFSAFVEQTNFKTDAENNKDEDGCWSLNPEDEDPWSYKNWASWRQPFQKFEVQSRHPVSCVSPSDIDQYITWLNAETKSNFRLPTEAEWEFAAKGKGGFIRPWGNDSEDACEHGNVADQFNDQSITGVPSDTPVWPTHHQCNDKSLFVDKVGAKKASFNGIYDLIGNVWEITCSQHSGSYANHESECATEPSNRTDKGGGWDSIPAEARSASRGEIRYFDRSSNIGFRLVIGSE